MTTSENPRAALDEALAEMRSTLGSSSQPVRLTAEATVACAEALSLLVDARLPHLLVPEPEPSPVPRESLPDDTPVGHGWVVDSRLSHVFKPRGPGRFTRWHDGAQGWGVSAWYESDFTDPRSATVGDLRRVGLPVTEWPDITAPEPEAEQPEAEALAERDNAIAALRAIRGQVVLGVCLADPNSDTRKIYRQSLTIVEAEARRRGIDLSEEATA